MTKKVIVSVLFAAFCLAGCKPSATNPEVTVTEAVYGCEDKQTIRITMQGGRAKYAICIVPTDPLMEPGQEFLILQIKMKMVPTVFSREKREDSSMRTDY